MANSLVKLTLESNQYEKGMRQAQKSWNDFTKGIGLSMSKFTAVGAAIGAVTGALNVAKDAFFKNEQQLDEWGRVVQSSQSLYGSFLNTLNNGDFSGFFHNIDNVVKAARSAYNAIDELATYNAFNRMNVADARANMSEAIGAYRLGEGSKEDVQSAVAKLKKELTVRQEKEWAAYIESVRSMAIDRNANPDDVVKLLGGSYVDFENAKNSWKPESFTKKNVSTLMGGSTVAGAMMGVNFGTRISRAPGSDAERLSNFARTLNDTELDKLQAMGEQAKNTKREIADLDKQLARVLNGKQPGSSTSGGGGGKGVFSNTKVEQTELQQNQAKINLLTQEYVTLGDVTTQQARDRKEAIQQEIHALDTRNNKLKLYAEQAQGKLQGGHVMQSNLGGDSQWSPSMSDKSYLNIGAGLSDDVMQKVKVLQQSGISASEAWKRAGTAVGLFGTAISAIKDPAAQVAATVAQAIASIAFAYSQALAEDQSTKPNIFAFLAASATAMVSMVTAIAQIRSSTSGYAQGGIVDGNSYSGDNIPIMANAGELVLTKADQASLINHLENNGMSGLGPSRISGEQIYITLNRYLKRSGQGELMTWG